MNAEHIEPMEAQEELLQLIVQNGFPESIPPHSENLYSGPFRVIFQACLALRKAGREIRDGTLWDHLRQSGQGNQEVITALAGIAGLPRRPLPDAPALLSRMTAWHNMQQAHRWGRQFLDGRLSLEDLTTRLVSLGNGGDTAADTLTAALRSALLSAAELVAMPLEQRPALLGPWLCAGDLGFIFAARGVGKTWLAMLIANAVATGAALGEWRAGEPRPVVYVDGEMNLPDSQERARLIGMQDGVQWLHHEHLFSTARQGLNLASPPLQSALLELLLPGSVLILDNLSALCRGVEENDNDAWEIMLGWLLECRRREITVIVIHHAGRNGQMRGASRREDAAHWILRIQDDTSASGQKALVTTFSKCRNCGPQDAPPLRWTLDMEAGERLAVACERHSGPEALKSLIAEGIETNAELAQELGVSPGQVSKWAKRLIDAGRIVKKGRVYALPN